MALYNVASLDDIAGLDAPHPDVVVVALDRLADARAALRSLEHHQRDRDWRVVNLRQVRLASTLASLLARAVRRMGSVQRAILKMAATLELVVSVGEEMKQHWVFAVKRIGVTAVQIAGAETEAQTAQADAIGRLDAAHLDICALLAGALATARMPHNAVATPWMPRPRTTPIGWDEDRLLGAMERGLLSLRDQNRSLHRRLGRLLTVANEIENFPRHPEGDHGLSKVDQGFKSIAVHTVVSVRELLGQLPAAGVVNAKQQQVLDELAKALVFNHTRFTGPMAVRSVQDVEEVFAASSPHVGDVGLPAWRATVSLRAVRLSDATAVHERVVEGIQQRGWTVFGMNSLQMAVQLDAQVVLLENALPSFMDPKVIGFLGVINDHDAINDIEQQADEIHNTVHAGLVVSAEASQLALDVIDVVKKAEAGDLDVRGHVKTLTDKLQVTRSSEVLFMEAP